MLRPERSWNGCELLRAIDIDSAQLPNFLLNLTSTWTAACSQGCQIDQNACSTLLSISLPLSLSFSLFNSELISTFVLSAHLFLNELVIIIEIALIRKLNVYFRTVWNWKKFFFFLVYFSFLFNSVCWHYAVAYLCMCVNQGLSNDNFDKEYLVYIDYYNYISDL